MSETTQVHGDIELGASLTAGDKSRRVEDSRRSAVAAGLDKAAIKLQAGGERVGTLALDAGDKVGHFAQNAAEKLEGTAQYLRDHDGKDMMADVGDLAKKHPGKVLIAVAMVGFLAGRAFRDK